MKVPRYITFDNHCNHSVEIIYKALEQFLHHWNKPVDAANANLAIQFIEKRYAQHHNHSYEKAVKTSRKTEIERNRNLIEKADLRRSSKLNE